MRPWLRNSVMVLLMVGLGIVQTPSRALADDDTSPPLSVTVAFGVGLNTAQPGNTVNHHVLPRTIHVRKGGVVNFSVAGFHQIFVYNPGTTPQDVLNAAPPFPGPLFINFMTNLYYTGINPANPANPLGANLGTPLNPTNVSGQVNRVEQVAFLESGLYLVICNVNPHFRDGMWADLPRPAPTAPYGRLWPL